MTDYTTPKIPPATSPVVNRGASAKDARTKADHDGDSDHDGSRETNVKAEEIEAANRAISRKSGHGRCGRTGARFHGTGNAVSARLTLPCPSYMQG